MSTYVPERVVTDLRALADHTGGPEGSRRLAWTPPSEQTDDAVAELLGELGARPWQVRLTSAAIAETLKVLADGPAEEPVRVETECLTADDESE